MPVSNSQGLTFGEALTHLPPSFAETAAQRQTGLAYHPVSNDTNLAFAYGDMAERLPQPDSTKTGVVLIVGNGAIETAGQLLPDALPVVHCDYNPRTLFLLRAARELVAHCADPTAFKREITRLESPSSDELDDLLDGNCVSNWIVDRYDYQRSMWASARVVHFLCNLEAYKNAQEAIAGREFAYNWTDFKNPEHVRRLGAQLAAHNYQIVGANVTNVFDTAHAGQDAVQLFATELPIHPAAVIISSSSGRGSGRMKAYADSFNEWRLRVAYFGRY